MSFSLGTLIAKGLSFIFSKTVVDGIVDTGKNWWNARQQRKNMELETELRIRNAETDARIKRIESNDKTYADNDKESIRQWKYTWADELLISTIVMLVFASYYPETQPYVENGNKILNEMPIWIQVIVAGAYMRVLGITFMIIAPLQYLFGRAK